MKLFRKISIFGLLGLFLIALPLVAFAGNDKTVYVGADEIIDGNLIRMGNIISINGAINGDVVVMGDSIEITGPVTGDVIALGNTIKVTGDVEGSVRAAGSLVEITKSVEKNFWAVGSTILVGDQARVGWDVYAAGASLSIKGIVDGGVNLAGENVVLSNEIKNNSTIKVGSTGQVVLLPEANLLSDLKIKSVNQDQLVLNDGAVIAGDTNFEEYQSKSNKPEFLAFGLFKLILLFSFLILGLLLVTFLPKYLLRVNSAMATKAASSIGWGFVFLIVAPVIIFVLLITVIGIPLAILLLLTYLITFFVSIVFAGFALGLYLFNQMSKVKQYQGSLIWPLVLGIVLLMILACLPYIGWIIKLVSMVWAVGALLRVEIEIIKSVE